MKKVSLITLTIGLLLSAILLANNPKAEENPLLDYLTIEILSTYELNPAKTEISIARSDIKINDFTGCEIQYYPLTSNKPKGRFPLRVEVEKDGVIIAKGSVSVMVRRYEDLLVPVRRIKRHEMLNPDMFTTKRTDVTSITEKLMTDVEDTRDCRAKQNLTEDRYFSSRRIEVIPDVENGKQITIIGTSPLMEIKTRGIALQQGYVGESIKVKNLDSKKIIYGTITAPGVVEVSI